MSRRTRIRSRNPHSALGRNHHTNYSSSSTYFPQAYSLIGAPISLPSKIMPICDHNKIVCILKENELLEENCMLKQVETQKLNSAQIVNITVPGKIVKTHQKFTGQCVLFCSIGLCCVSSMLDAGWFRRNFFTRYEMGLKEYSKLGQILAELTGCQNLVVNIQDNYLTQEKMKILLASIEKSMGSNLVNDGQTKTTKTVTIRNFCYFMNEIKIQNLVDPISDNPCFETTFIWQKQIVRSCTSKGQKDENKSLLSC